jgi:hypothetical protein
MITYFAEVLTQNYVMLSVSNENRLIGDFQEEYFFTFRAVLDGSLFLVGRFNRMIAFRPLLGNVWTWRTNSINNTALKFHKVNLGTLSVLYRVTF